MTGVDLEALPAVVCDQRAAATSAQGLLQLGLQQRPPRLIANQHGTLLPALSFPAPPGVLEHPDLTPILPSIAPSEQEKLETRRSGEGRGRIYPPMMKMLKSKSNSKRMSNMGL